MPIELILQYTRSGESVVPDGDYAAKVFPNCAVFKVHQPILGFEVSRIALVHNGSMNASLDGSNGIVKIRNGVITCDWTQ